LLDVKHLVDKTIEFLTESIRLLSEASVNDTNKFRSVPLERSKSKGRPPKHYRPLLNKEKMLQSTVRRILPKDIAESVSPSGSRLAHVYGLPKTHKEKLAVRPILSATSTYNYALAKWLDNKLKPLSLNQHTVTDIFDFVNEVRELKINKGYILVSYDVSCTISKTRASCFIGVSKHRETNESTRP